MAQPAAVGAASGGWTGGTGEAAVDGGQGNVGGVSNGAVGGAGGAGGAGGMLSLNAAPSTCPTTSPAASTTVVRAYGVESELRDVPAGAGKEVENAGHLNVGH